MAQHRSNSADFKANVWASGQFEEPYACLLQTSSSLLCNCKAMLLQNSICEASFWNVLAATASAMCDGHAALRTRI